MKNEMKGAQEKNYFLEDEKEKDKPKEIEEKNSQKRKESNNKEQIKDQEKGNEVNGKQEKEKKMEIENYEDIYDKTIKNIELPNKIKLNSKIFNK